MAVPSPSHSGAGAATYFIPSENEWYKAAYYDPTLNGGAGGYWAYPTKSNTAPINTLPDTGNHANFYDYYGTGNHTWTDPTNYLTPVGDFVLSPGPYGTYDMGGDVFQWNEAIVLGGIERGLRGGAWGSYPYSLGLASSYRYDTYAADEDFQIGFRVAGSVAVPEPGSIALLLAGAVAYEIWRLRRKAWRSTLRSVSVLQAPGDGCKPQSRGSARFSPRGA